MPPHQMFEFGPVVEGMVVITTLSGIIVATIKLKKAFWYSSTSEAQDEINNFVRDWDKAHGEEGLDTPPLQSVIKLDQDLSENKGDWN